MNQNPPTLEPYARHVFFCEGPCDPDGDVPDLYTRLRELLGDLNHSINPLRVVRGLSSCLGACSGGPILVVYPEGIWYHHVDEHKLERIVEEHLKGGKPVEEYIFHRL